MQIRGVLPTTGLDDMPVEDVGSVDVALSPARFRAASGEVLAGTVAPLQRAALREEIEPRIGERTPTILSAGTGCVLLGCLLQ